MVSQHWSNLLFAHWPIASGAVARLLPQGLSLDTYEGQAWVAVVPFKMREVRVGRLPTVAGTGEFLELNLRTYVVGQGGVRGVWFFSLDASHPLVVEVARRWFGLNYLKARMEMTEDADGFVYRSVRDDQRSGHAELMVTYRPVDDQFTAEPGSLEDFLTSRNSLFALRRGCLIRAGVEHMP